MSNYSSKSFVEIKDIEKLLGDINYYLDQLALVVEETREMWPTGNLNSLLSNANTIETLSSRVNSDIHIFANQYKDVITATGGSRRKAKKRLGTSR